VQAVAGAEQVEAYLDRTAALGLIEAGIDPSIREPRYFVSKILTLLLAGELTEEERKDAYRSGAKVLYALWGEEGDDGS